MTLLTLCFPGEELQPAPDSARGEECRLVRRAQRGDQQAFGQLVRLHSRRIFRFIFQYTRQVQDAEDLTQQTFVKAYRHLASFDPQRPLLNWLFTIARHATLNHLRNSNRWEELPESSTANDHSPSEASSANDDRDTLWEMARTVLSVRQYETLWLRFGEDLSTRETARVLGISRPLVKILIYRAKAKLRKTVRP